MAVSVEVPDFGEAAAGGVVAEWYRDDGALVGVGEVLCRVESDFVAIEVEAEGEGTLRHQKPAGSIERAGALLGLILGAGEAMPPAATGRSAALEDHPLEDPPVGDIEGCVEVPEPEEDVAEAPEPDVEEPREAVVVPFPRRFAASPSPGWDEAPGDAAEFGSAPWSEAPPERTQTLVEPGGSIPGLPLWEPDEAAVEAPEPDAARDRFARISREAAAAAQVLHATVMVDTAEARKMRAVCAREWQRSDGQPLLEDILFRAIALALHETDGATVVGGILLAEADSDVSSGISGPAQKNFREALTERERGGDAPFESADWLLVSLAQLGLLSCTPRLEGGRQVAFAVGADDEGGRAVLTMAFDSMAWSETSAARLLARIRELFEAPYAMLV